MRFDISIDIDAPSEAVWRVLTDLDAWPSWTESVTRAQRLDDGPLAAGSHVSLKQPGLPEAVWQVTRIDPRSYFERRLDSVGMTTLAAHRVERAGYSGSRLTLSVEHTGPLAPLFGRLNSGMTRRYLALETQGLKRAVEAA
jgi:hypothetical protein